MSSIRNLVFACLVTSVVGVTPIVAGGWQLGPIKGDWPPKISVPSEGGSSSGSSSATSVNFTVVNSCHYPITYFVRQTNGSFTAFQLNPGYNRVHRHEVWGGYGNNGSWSESGPIIRFGNARRANWEVTPRHQGKYVFYQGPSTLEMRW